MLDDSGIVRHDIRRSFGSSRTLAKGVPLRVNLTVTDASKDYAPMAGAAVYLWHCDRSGRYSMYSSGVEDENYLRGIAKTDSDGTAWFRTIFPACYSGRWPHIHFEVYSSVAKAVANGPIVKTSQIALPKAVCSKVYATSGYSGSVSNLARTSLSTRQRVQRRQGDPPARDRDRQRQQGLRGQPYDRRVSDDDDEPEAGRLPTGRIARTARVGGLVTGQGLRWAGMRTANRVRSPERAAAARDERTAKLVGELVDQLGRMRGAAMKVGQLLSMIEFDGLPEEQRTELESKLATLRDDIPPVPFAKLEKLMRYELGGPLSSVFSEFDERALAAASIGQVHRATMLDGEAVVVKVQYPGVAEAVDSDLRSATLLLPLLKRLAPDLDAKPLLAELRERIGEELDYELEAQQQRRIERLYRGHPFISVPRVRTDLSTRRVLVSEFVEGERFEAVRELDSEQRDRYGEIVFRFFFGLLYRGRIALGDPHPGNYLLRPDGRVAFLDYGLVRDFGAARIDAERAIALPCAKPTPRRWRRRWSPAGTCATARASTPSWR